MANLAACARSSQASTFRLTDRPSTCSPHTPFAAISHDNRRARGSTLLPRSLTTRGLASTKSLRYSWVVRGAHNVRRGSKSKVTLNVVQSHIEEEDTSDTFSLDEVRNSLIRQEDSIIFSLIERAQFKLNAVVYQSDAIAVPMYERHTGKRASFLEYYLRESEQMHGKMRRYTSPDEMAFYPGSLPPLVLPALKYPSVLVPNNITLNDDILKLYVDTLVPGICKDGDDHNYGSTAMFDVQALQALSQRIHYGKFVAEAKFRSSRDMYTALIKAQDAAAIMDTLTFAKVEKHVVDRVTKKAATYGQDITEMDAVEGKKISYKVEPELVGELYSKWVMPLTKKVQVKYLLERLNHGDN